MVQDQLEDTCGVSLFKHFRCYLDIICSTPTTLVTDAQESPDNINIQVGAHSLGLKATVFHVSCPVHSMRTAGRGVLVGGNNARESANANHVLPN